MAESRLPGPARDGEVASAEDRLDHLNLKVAAMRAVLVQLLQDVVRAESGVDHDQAARLLEANERLVISGLELQAEIDTSAGALDEVTRAGGLDPLTQLPNRTMLLDRLERAIASARRHHKRVAVLFLDLNNFKQVNDRFGHAAGDLVLQRVAACLAGLVRETDTVSRHGGDEFIMLLAEVAEAADAGIIADKVNAALRTAAGADAELAQVTASIGISIYPDDGEDAQALIGRADAAMYRAKRQPSGTFVASARAELPAPAPAKVLSPHEQVVAEHEHRHQQLVEANQQLVLAALGFDALHDAADTARRRRVELLDAVAQELGNPQAPIRIAASLLGRGSVHEELLHRAVVIVEQQMEHMASAVGALLESAAAPNIELKGAHVFDLCTLATDVVAACRVAIDRRRQSLDVQMPAGPIDVRGDRAHLAQALARLLGNATDYTQDGGRLWLQVDVKGASVQLIISDDGMGFRAGDVATILEPFVRDPRAAAADPVCEDHFGMGLTTARSVVEAHAGTLSATSAGIGRGSQFTVTLPVETPATHTESRSFA